jgi:hypothetical protein
MSAEKQTSSNRKAIAVAVLAAIILFPVGYSIVTYVFARGAADTVPFIEMPDSRYDKCVRETAYMRYHHWELLRQIRDEVVRDGRRGEIGLNSCRECHPNRDRFCNCCHKAVSLSPDCFGCHYYPDTPVDAEDVAQLDNPESRTGTATIAAGHRHEE